MIQMQLPFFPEGVTNINSVLAFQKKDGQVVYMNGHMPIFIHDEKDIRAFRMITAQFCDQGTVKQAEIAKAFGIPKIAIKRAVKLFRKKGPKGFFEPRKTRGAAILTKPVLTKAQNLLDEGYSIPDVAKKLAIKKDTLRKAVDSGRLHKVSKKKLSGKEDERPASTKSQRSGEDSSASMGMGATDVPGRLAASIGQSGPPTLSFQPAFDVPNGGVLLAIPSLLANGLLRHTENFFNIPKGFYSLSSIFLLLGLMALCRIRSLEDLRHCAPGEWGNLLGLDRIPEIRTMRGKVNDLSQDNRALEWSAKLCTEWMEAAPESTAFLYVDGHVRVYNGKKTKLPRHYVAREKLCLRATTDYWVNAMDSQPFFMVNKPVDPGLIKVLEKEIVPRLEKDIPNQPSVEELEADQFLHRFAIVFDREGYSPGFMLRMKQKRIACISYNKYPGDDWAKEEFVSTQVNLVSGEIVEMFLAERGVFLGKMVWVREIRKLTESGHQTSILSTGYRLPMERTGTAMFARWSQENFFKYMRKHYNLDGLISYSTEDIPDTTQVVNPAYRELDGQVRSKTGKLSRKLAKFGAMDLKGNIDPKNVEKFEREKANLKEEIDHMEREISELKSKRKSTTKHITIGELSEEERFQRLNTKSKHLIDTIKMIAYRSETSMANFLRGIMPKKDEARSLLQTIYNCEADILPNEKEGTLTIQIHNLANKSSGVMLQNLCNIANETETAFPGTNLRLIYKMVSSQNP